MTKQLQIANNKVVGAGECLGYQEGNIHYQIFNIVVSDEIFNAYIEDARKVVYDSLSNQIILNPDYEEIIARGEAERVAHLSVTKSDFFDATIKAFGIDGDDLYPIVEEVIQKQPVGEKLRKIALNNYKNAKDFYRNHAIFEVIAGQPIRINEDLTIVITSEQFDNFFRAVNEGDKENAYRELLPKD